MQQQTVIRNLGLQILSDLAKIDKKTDAYQLGFVLGPRINAGGRVGLPDAGARLLSSNDPLESLELAKILDANNSTRKEIEALVLEEAILQVEKNRKYNFSCMRTSCVNSAVYRSVQPNWLEARPYN